MSAQQFDAGTLEVVQEAIRRRIEIGQSDVEIRSALKYGYLTAEQMDQIDVFLVAMRALGGPEPSTTTEVGGMPTADEVKRERMRRRLAGEPSGYDALARHFHCSPATIRRRLGVPEPK